LVVFEYQKSQFGYIAGALVKENVGIFYGHLVYFTCIWYSLRPFGIQYGHLVYFTAIWLILCPFGILYFPFWYVVPRNIWQHWLRTSGTDVMIF
jgi:hypothetical protein